MLNISDYSNKILQGDIKMISKQLPDAIANCIITSPPYFNLRDYGMKAQIGLERTPEQYINSLVKVFRELKRVLKKDGTLWINISDSYNSASSNQNGRKDKKSTINPVKFYTNGDINVGRKKLLPALKPKDLIGIPWMLAFSLRKDGWYWRDTIIWHKPNPMPESVTDRTTKSHEYILLFSKSPKYYYDHTAIKTPISDASVQRLLQDIENQKGSDRVPGKTNGTMKAVVHKNMARDGKLHSFYKSRKGAGYDDTMAINRSGVKGHSGNFNKDGVLIGDGMANKKSVWIINTKPNKDAHFAIFPTELIIDPIKAGCPEGGIVLDPFMGSGTTAIVAKKLNRNYIGIELNPDYIKIADNRLRKEFGLFL